MTKTEQLHANLAAIRFERDSSTVGAYNLAKTCEDGSYILITDDNGGSLPKHGETIVIGHYDALGGPLNMVTLPYNVDRYEIDADVEASLDDEIRAVVDAIMVEYL